MYKLWSLQCLILAFTIFPRISLAAPSCAEIFAKIGEQRTSESRKFCFFGLCTNVSFVSEVLDLRYLGELVGKGISLKYKLKDGGTEKQVEGFIMKQDGGSKMTILTEKGIQQVKNWEIEISQLVVFNTDIKPESRVKLNYNNFLVRLDLLAVENSAAYVHFDLRLNRNDIDMVAKVENTDGGFLFELVDGSSYWLSRSTIESVSEKGGDYQILTGLK